MDHLGFVEAIDGFGEGIVVAVPDAANRRFDARRGKPLGIFDREVLGGFKWSSQHLDKGGCTEYSKAAFGSLRARCVAVTGSALGGAA
jgi:hypothetical protein